MRANAVRRSRLVIAVTTLALVAAACSGSSSPKASGTTGGSSGTGGATTTTAASAATAAFNQAQFSGEPQIGGSIKFGVESQLATLDPAGNLAQPADLDVSLAIYDPLIDFDAKGNYAPGLATKWTNSPDLKTWTLTLRSGVTFSDGTPFNAQAVVDQFQRCEDPKTSCTAGPSITGTNLVTPSAPNPTTVVFKLATPNALFLSTLTGVLGLTASPAATAKWGSQYARHPVGTGPFVLKSFDSLELDKNPNYWKKDAQGRQLPYLDKITVVPLADSVVRLQTLEAGDVDAIQTDDTNNIIASLKQKDLTIQKIDGSSATITIFNMRKPPFNDVRMRQAIAYGINRQELDNVVYQGSRELAYSPFATNSPFYSADIPWPKFDPAKARKLVAEAKAAGTPTSFTTTCIATPEGHNGLAVTQKDGKAIGLHGSNEFLDQGAYVNKVIGATHDFTVGCFRDPQIADADGLYNVLHTNGSGNVMGYSNKTVDKDLEAIRKTTDQKEQIRLLHEIQVQLAHDVPVMPLLYDLFANIYNNKISGFPIPQANSLGAIKFATLYIKK